MPRAPTVRELLDHEVLSWGEPEVVGGADGLDSAVRWVHVSELPDIADLLKGGELILTTGMCLPESDQGLARYIDDLSTATASGVIIELGRRYETTPRALTQAADRRGLPLVALRREIRFVKVTEAIHGLILNAQVADLQQSELVHQTFTELSLEGASAQEIVRRASEMVRRPIVAENLARQVVVFDAAGQDVDQLLRNWARRSRRLLSSQPTQYLTAEGGWLVSSIGARGEVWGRLVMPCEREPDRSETVVLERTAAALALTRLLDRALESLEGQGHRNLLEDIRERSYSSTAEVHLRSEALGVPLGGAALVAAVVRFTGEVAAGETERQAQSRSHVDIASAAVSDANVTALVGPLGNPACVAVLLVLRDSNRAETLEAFARGLHRCCATTSPTRGAVIGVGSTVETVHDVRRSFREAEQVADAAQTAEGEKLYYEVLDVRLRGLMQLLKDDARVQTFADRELGVLLAYDEKHGTDLTTVLRSYLDHGQNKSRAAEEIGISRPSLYNRLEIIQRTLGFDLRNTETCHSLYVALLAHESTRLSSMEWR